MAARAPRLSLLLGLLSLSGLASAAPLEPQQIIKVCATMAEWPPYMYYQRLHGQKSDQLVGLTAEYLQRIMAAQGLRYQLDLLPWQRCLESARRGLYDMMTDVSTNDERAKIYLVSRPYYAMTLVYFYDKSRPKPPIHSAADLKKLRLCAVSGYNYAVFGLKPEDIQTGSQSMGQSYQKLKHDRCDAMPERLEVAYGYQMLGVADFEQLNIGVGQLPDLKPSTFHFMVSRSVPYGRELLTVLDAGIEKIQNSAAGKEIALRYSIPGVDLSAQHLPGSAKPAGKPAGVSADIRTRPLP